MQTGVKWECDVSNRTHKKEIIGVVIQNLMQLRFLIQSPES